MVQIPYYNTRGQQVGIYDTETKTYHTKRYAERGQIFLKKNMFNGKYKERAIAIDRSILKSLIAKNCEWIVFTIIGVEKWAYSVRIKPRDIILKGVIINFDKTNKYGVNYTGFGEQYVISSVSDCIRININQLELKNTKILKNRIR